MSEIPFEIHSDAVIDGVLSDEYGIKNQGGLREGIPSVSFPLSWHGAPNGTVSYALVFMDYDNVEDEGVPWIHWLVADIPLEVDRLKKNESRTNPNLIQGSNSWSLPYGPYGGSSREAVRHYGGPAPGRIHEYECTIFALDCFLDLNNGFHLNQLRRAMEGHVLEKKTLKMLYNPN